MLYPDFEELLQMGYKASRMNLASRRHALSIVSGDQQSPFRGKGLEFEEVREYVPGDDVRNIDWRVTARTGRPHLKLFTEERERSVIICNDVNLSMRFGTRVTFKSIQAARAAALLGWAGVRSHHRLGASFFGNVQGGMLFLDPARSRRSLWRMLKQLCDREIYFEEPAPLADHLRYLNKATPAGSLVFIISDFLEPGENLKRRLSDLHRRADVVIVSVNDPADSLLPSVGPILFTDGAGRRKALDTSEKGGRKAYERLWAENREQLRAIILSLGLGHIALSTDRDVHADLVNGVKRLRGKKGGRHGRPAVAAA